MTVINVFERGVFVETIERVLRGLTRPSAKHRGFRHRWADRRWINYRGRREEVYCAKHDCGYTFYVDVR